MGSFFSRSELWKELGSGVYSYLVHTKNKEIKRKDVTITTNWLIFSYPIDTYEYEFDNNSVHDIIIGIWNRSLRDVDVNITIYIDDLEINYIILNSGSFSYILPGNNILALTSNRNSFIRFKIMVDEKKNVQNLDLNLEIISAQCLTNQIRKDLLLHKGYSVLPDNRYIMYEKGRINVMETSCSCESYVSTRKKLFIPSLSHL
jgi:hypothetical protein